MIDPGIRLQLLIGPTVPRPAPFKVVDALVELEVTSNDDERDGFQLTFTIGKETPTDYALLTSIFEPPARVVIQVFVGFLPCVLIDGVITNHQFSPSNRPGDSTLVVTGEDISIQLDLKQKSKTFANQSDSSIARTILDRYATYGIRQEITNTSETPNQNELVPSQQGTDLAFLRELAARNGFVFYIEPDLIPSRSIAYFGPENRQRRQQQPLSLNMGPITNIESLAFSFNGLGPATPEVFYIDPKTRKAIPVSVPASSLTPLASQPARPLRSTIPRNLANREAAQAALAALATSNTSSTDATTATGELDTVRYGRVLRSRSLVGVRGVGKTYGGYYYVKQVTHRIRRGEYKQSFTLTREGRGTTTSLLMPS
jgi:hypothetical protein